MIQFDDHENFMLDLVRMKKACWLLCPTGFRVKRVYGNDLKLLQIIIVLDRPFGSNRSQDRKETVASLFCSGNEFTEY